MRINKCKVCNVELNKDTVALNKKMFGRNIAEFECLDCLADRFDCSVEDLLIKIEEFKEEGCALFN